MTLLVYEAFFPICCYTKRAICSCYRGQTISGNWNFFHCQVWFLHCIARPPASPGHLAEGVGCRVRSSWLRCGPAAPLAAPRLGSITVAARACSRLRHRRARGAEQRAMSWFRGDVRHGPQPGEQEEVLEWI